MSPDSWGPSCGRLARGWEAAHRLVELRDGWPNPPGLDPAVLAKRTLTNLYNQRPTWLANAHADLDVAVFAAYGWAHDLTDTEILGPLLALNHTRPTKASRSIPSEPHQTSIETGSVAGQDGRGSWKS